MWDGLAHGRDVERMVCVDGLMYGRYAERVVWYGLISRRDVKCVVRVLFYFVYFLRAL